MILSAFDSYIHERSVDVIGALPVDGDQEGEAAVWREDIHAAVLLVVPGQQGDAAVLHPQRGSHHIQSLSGWKQNYALSYRCSKVGTWLLSVLIISQYGN